MNSLPETDLSTTFTPAPSRVAGLAGKLPPVTPAPPADAPTGQPAATDTADTADTAAAPTPSAKSASAPKPAPAQQKTATSAKQVTVYMSVELAERMKAHADTTADTITMTVLDAIDALHRSDATAPADDNAPQGNSLFRARRTRRKRVTTQVGLYLYPDDIEAIDRLKDERGFANRSALVETAVTNYLPSDTQTDGTAE